MAGQLIDWYKCTSQGHYPDPTSCDHYIACNAALIAYQVPCGTTADGQRLWFVRDSGPIEQESYCDLPEKVECDI